MQKLLSLAACVVAFVALVVSAFGLLGSQDSDFRESNLEDAIAPRNTGSRESDLVEDDTTPGVCKLHHVPYAVETIPVSYGYPALPQPTEGQKKWLEEERAAWWKDFRYSHLPSGAGGCVVRPAKFAKVSYCPECRKADEAWHAKHGQSALNRK